MLFVIKNQTYVLYKLKKSKNKIGGNGVKYDYMLLQIYHPKSI